MDTRTNDDAARTAAPSSVLEMILPINAFVDPESTRITLGGCGVVPSRLADLTGLYHVPQVFYVTSCQLTYSYTLRRKY